MAGDWIPWVYGLTRRAEVIQISTLLGITRNDAACALMAIWEWCDAEGHYDVTEMSRNCHVQGVTCHAVEMVSGVTGMCDAMKKCGWMVETEDGHPMFPKLGRWVGKSAKERLLARERKRKERENVTEMSRSDRDKNVTRVDGDGDGELLRSSLRVDRDESPFCALDWGAVRIEARRFKGMGVDKLPQDRSLVLKTCALAVAGRIPRHWLETVLEEMPKKKRRKPGAYVMAIMKSKAKEAGLDFRRLLAETPEPPAKGTP